MLGGIVAKYLQTKINSNDNSRSRSLSGMTKKKKQNAGASPFDVAQGQNDMRKRSALVMPKRRWGQSPTVEVEKQISPLRCLR